MKGSGVRNPRVGLSHSAQRTHRATDVRSDDKRRGDVALCCLPRVGGYSPVGQYRAAPRSRGAAQEAPRFPKALRLRPINTLTPHDVADLIGQAWR